MYEDMKIDKGFVRLTYWRAGLEYGLEQVIEGNCATLADLRGSVEFLLKALAKDHESVTKENARHPGANT